MAKKTTAAKAPKKTSTAKKATSVVAAPVEVIAPTAVTVAPTAVVAPVAPEAATAVVAPVAPEAPTAVVAPVAAMTEAPTKVMDRAEYEAIVRKAAFDLADMRGFRNGSAFSDWTRAEAIVRDQLARQGVRLTLHPPMSA